MYCTLHSSQPAIPCNVCMDSTCMQTGVQMPCMSQVLFSLKYIPLIEVGTGTWNSGQNRYNSDADVVCCKNWYCAIPCQTNYCTVHPAASFYKILTTPIAHPRYTTQEAYVFRNILRNFARAPSFRRVASKR